MIAWAKRHHGLLFHAHNANVLGGVAVHIEDVRDDLKGALRKEPYRCTAHDHGRASRGKPRLSQNGYSLVLFRLRKRGWSTKDLAE